MDTNREK